MSDARIYVTQPNLPPLDEFLPYLEQIWDSKMITNMGAFHQELEGALCDYLNVPYLSLFNNGTTALLTAMQALDVTGEVITTPFTFAATSNSLLFSKLQPVFVDIEPDTLNMDPAKIEAAITDKTSAIVPVHCYGNPCDVTAIQAIADKHELKIVYDAAHAFAVQVEQGSLLNFGDLSILSFHATKVFNTIEGGAIICHDKAMKTKIDQLKNFGIVDEATGSMYPGINGKLNELQAAMGLLQLKTIDDLIAQRKQIDSQYRQAINDIQGLKPIVSKQIKTSNYGYFPILVEQAYPLTRDELCEELKKEGIYARKYFFPLVSNLPTCADIASAQPSNLPFANEIANKILCLPIYPNLENKQVAKIINKLRGKASWVS